MSGQHSDRPPSSASQWGNCGGWAKMTEGIPDRENERQKFGDECHAWVAQGVAAAARAAPAPPAPSEEHRVAGQPCIDHCAALMREFAVFGGPGLFIERTVTPPDLLARAWGTPDFALYVPAKRRVIIRDHKFGFLPVNPDTPQLWLYAAGVIEELELSDVLDDLYLDLGVIQPCRFARAPVANVVMRGVELRLRLNKLRNKIEQKGPCSSGPHCRDCLARHRCPAYLSSVDTAFQFVAEGEPTDMTPLELGTYGRALRDALWYLERMQDAVEGQIEGHIRNGKPVPGWGYETSRGRDRWVTGKRDEILAAGALFGVDLDGYSLKTPNQAIAAGVDAGYISGYYTAGKESQKLTITDTTKLKSIFGE